MSFLFRDKNAKLAEMLVTAAKLPAELKERTKYFMINEEFKKNPPKDSQRLIKLINHPCESEQIEVQVQAYDNKVKQLGEEAESEDPGTGLPLKQPLLDATARALAIILGAGFDDAMRDNLVFDEAGRPIGLRESGGDQRRFKKCHEYLTSSQNLQKLTSSAESDPYKGSLQGMGRKSKTRKHSKKSRKTLRRNKMRRNMH